MSGLQYLDISGNKISDIRFLENLTNLQFLDLSNNQIADISPIFPLIEKGVPVTMKESGSGILLSNNPLTNPPPKIVKQGNAAILEYRQKKQRPERNRYWKPSSSYWAMATRARPRWPADCSGSH